MSDISVRQWENDMSEQIMKIKRLKEEKKELLDILTDLASMVESIEVNRGLDFEDIWGKDYAQNVRNVYEKAWEIIHKYEGDNDEN